jgi:hypothetical protein
MYTSRPDSAQPPAWLLPSIYRPDLNAHLGLAPDADLPRTAQLRAVDPTWTAMGATGRVRRITRSIVARFGLLTIASRTRASEGGAR